MKLEIIKKHYWACDKCNTNAGGVFPEGHVCTMTEGECKVCGDTDVMLIPWVDYNWDNKQDDMVAKLNRY